MLLNALGGRKTTTRTICSACNNKFGNLIDKELARQSEFIRNLLQLDSGSGNPAPALKKIKAGNDIINIQGDGKLSLVVKPFKWENLPDGRVNIEINAESMEHLEKLIPDIAAATKISEADLRNQLAGAEIRQIERRPGTVHASLSFGGQDAIRSATKACLVLWALHVGNEQVRGPAYKAVRDFITDGSDTFSSTRTALDARYLNAIDRIKSKYGPVFNFIYVRSDESGRVIGHFTLYNIIGFQIVLAESGGTPNRMTALVSNPLSPSDWSDDVATEFEQSFEWLEKPEYYDDFDTQRQRVADVMKNYFDIFRNKELHRIMDSVFDKHGVGEDDPIPHEKRDAIFSEISARLAAHMLGLPYENRMAPDQVKAFFQRMPSKKS